MQGVVVDNIDPKAIHRVKVNVPALNITAWAPVATFFASHKAGASFIPAIDDHVLVGFIGGDTNSPVVIGSLYSTRRPPAPMFNENPSVSGIRTAGGSEIVFNDDDSSVKVRTGAGATITLAHTEIVIEDAFGNAVKLLKSGIRIESTGTVTVQSDRAIEIESGQNVDIKAAASVKAEGSAGAELSSGGTTEVKGAMVMIN